MDPQRIESMRKNFCRYQRRVTELISVGRKFLHVYPQMICYHIITFLILITNKEMLYYYLYTYKNSLIH